MSSNSPIGLLLLFFMHKHTLDARWMHVGYTLDARWIHDNEITAHC